MPTNLSQRRGRENTPTARRVKPGGLEIAADGRDREERQGLDGEAVGAAHGVDCVATRVVPAEGVAAVVVGVPAQGEFLLFVTRRGEERGLGLRRSVDAGQLRHEFEEMLASSAAHGAGNGVPQVAVAVRAGSSVQSRKPPAGVDLGAISDRGATALRLHRGSPGR